MRQGILKLEQHWLTRHWVNRVLATLFGVIVTDCFYASRYTHRDEMSGMELLEFVDRLAFQLINNSDRRRMRAGADSEKEVPQEIWHTLKPLLALPTYRQKKNSQPTESSAYTYRTRRHCAICGQRVAYYCATCYECTGGLVFGISSPTTGRNCLGQHGLASM